MYNIELYNSQSGTQTFTADITAIVENLRYEIKLNDVATISFSLPLYNWNAYCSETGIDPYLILIPKTAEIKIKRNGTYLPVVFEITSSEKSYNENPTIQVQGVSTLGKLADRIITKTYTNIDACDIARDLITTSQAKTGGGLGITFGNAFDIGTPTTRTYERYIVMDAIKELSDDTSGGFDFYFDHDWKFYTMATLGSLQDDINYTFPSENVIEFSNPENSSNLYNSITAVGYGIGDPITATATDASSVSSYGLREKALVYSSVQTQATLQRIANTELANRKDIFNLPKITTTGEFFDLNAKWIGDTIPFTCNDVASPYTGTGRIQRLSVSCDDMHNETISLELLV